MSPVGTSSSVSQHRAAAPRSVGCAVLTISDTRTEETDTSGAFIHETLTGAGHHVFARQIVPDDASQIRALIDTWAADDQIQAIISNGGTGIAGRDTTYEVIASLLEKRLDGFGELFRMLSYQEIGAAAMLSRAIAGVYQDRILIAMPGSTNAVRLGMEKLVLPELSHLIYEITRQR